MPLSRVPLRVPLRELYKRVAAVHRCYEGSRALGCSAFRVWGLQGSSVQLFVECFRAFRGAFLVSCEAHAGYSQNPKIS